MQNPKEIIRDFRNRSRRYNSQKLKIRNFKLNYPYLYDKNLIPCMSLDINTNAKLCMNVDFMRFEIQLLEECTESVDRDFQLIRELCGEEAEEIIRRNFVNGEDWDSIALDKGISRRTLSRLQNEWYESFVAAKSKGDECGRTEK